MQCMFCGKPAVRKEYLCEKCLADAGKVSFHIYDREDTRSARIPLDEVPARSVFDCPRCNLPMTFEIEHDAYIEECQSCGGSWYNRDAFTSAMDSTILHPYTAPETKILHEATRRLFVYYTEKKRTICCPQCKQVMMPTNFGRNSGITIDVCGHHGVWFDKDEVAGIMKFIQGGGLETPQFEELLKQGTDTLLPKLHYQLDALKSLKNKTDQKLFAAIVFGTMI